MLEWGRAVGKVGSALAVGLAITSCGHPEPENPKAGDVIYLVRAPALSPATPGETSTVSVYEFGPNPASREPGNRRVITGKRIRFRADHSRVDATNRRSGPHFRFTLVHDFIDPERVTAGNPNTVIAKLGASQQGGNLAPANITRSEGRFGGIGPVPPGALVKSAVRVCDMDAYEVTALGDSERSSPRYPPHPKAALFVERYGGSMVFAVRGPGGVYSDVISCSREKPTCSADTSYRGWPVEIVFGNEHVCDYQKIASSTRLLFDRFYLDETERSRGQTDRLWYPAPIREAAP